MLFMCLHMSLLLLFVDEFGALIVLSSNQISHMYAIVSFTRFYDFRLYSLLCISWSGQRRESGFVATLTY